MRLAVPLALTAALVLAAAAAFAQDASKTVGRPAVDIRTTHVVNLPRTRHPLYKLQGRLVLVQFFTTFGGHDKAAVPHLVKLRDQLGPEGLTVLAVTMDERERVDAFMKENGVTYATCVVDSDDYEKLRHFYSYPGMPWGYLVDGGGTVIWEGHPQSLKAPRIRAYLGSATAAPRMPDAFSSVQGQLDDGLWAAARTALLGMVESAADKTTKGWAKGVAGWIERRGAAVFEEAAKLEAEGAWWDAWRIYDDYPRRFEGFEGVPKAQELAAAVRANKDAEADLALGDRVARAGELMAKGQDKKAKLIITRILKKHRDTRHGKRCLALLNPVE